MAPVGGNEVGVGARILVLATLVSQPAVLRAPEVLLN